MKKLSFLKMIHYFVLCGLIAAMAEIVQADQADASVSSYKLVDIKHGPVISGGKNFGQYFFVEEPKMDNKGGYIDIASTNGQGQVLARNRFQWEFSRTADYLFPGADNHLNAYMAIGGTKTGHYMEARGEAITNDLIKLHCADAWPSPNEKAYTGTGWKTIGFHVRVWEHTYEEHTAIGFYITLRSPISDAIGGYYAVAYLYQDSAKAPSGGNVVAAQITSLWPVYNANCGGTATLWALTNNTGNITLPSDASVWFYVSGPHVDGFVGSSSVASLKAGYATWGSYNWAIPYNKNGTYAYWATVWSPTLGFISPWSQGMNFTVSCE